MTDSHMGECYFWKLPLELRFEVYGLAYGSGRIIQPRSTRGLLELKVVSRKLTAVKQSPNSKREPKNVGENRLVSKQFHAESMQYLVENNTFRLSRHGGSLYSVTPQFARDIRYMILDWHNHEFNDKLDLKQLCPKLASLEISVRFEFLDRDVFARHTVPTEDEIRKSSIAVALSLVHGLTHFAIHNKDEQSAVALDSAWDPRKPVVTDVACRINLLEEVLRSIVTREKTRNKARFPRAAKKTTMY